VHSRLIDQGYTHSRLLFRGTNSKFGLGYSRETHKSIFDFSALASSGKMESKSGNLPSNLTLIHPSIGYLRKIKTYKLSKKENAFFAGIHLSSINYYLENEPVIDNIDIVSLHGIYFNFRNRLTLTKNQSFQLTYLMPAIIYENRVLWNSGASNITYSDRDNILKTLMTRGRFSYFNVLRNVQFKAEYIVRLSDGADFDIQYGFFYLNSFKDAPIHLYSNELLLGLKFKF